MSVAEKLNEQPFDPSQGRSSKRVSLIQVARAVGKRINPGKPNTEFNYQEILKFAWVPVNKCAFNYARQRLPVPGYIKKLHTKWNINCVTPCQARYSAVDDTYYIADGQQHAIDWVLQYGENSMIQVCYVDTDDETIESIQLLALNTDNEPMAKYFIHQQKVIMGVPEAVALENMVNQAGCTTGYKKRVAGVITHIADLLLARDHYGLDSLGQVLSKMRQYWPTEKISTAAMLGFLKVKDLMEDHNAYSDEVFEDVFFCASEFFLNCDRLHKDIKDEFEKAYPTNYKGLGVREKVASGIIDAYEKVTKKNLVPAPFEIDMPIMEEELA